MRRAFWRVVAALSVVVPLVLVASPSEASTPLIYRLRGIGDGTQVISVTNTSWTSTYATVRAWEKQANGSWKQVFGPWTARVGRNGFGSPKREGDGQSPVGAFRVFWMFGVNALSGTQYRYTRVDRSDVWVDDPGSAYYNRHMRAPAYGRWRSAESLYQPTAYAYAAFIGYNLAATPGAGSAIFLHASTGSATAGCVSVSQSQVVALLRWLDPVKAPRVIMGPESAVAS